MARILIATALVLALARDEKSDLLAAAKKAAEAKSCSFRGETRLVLPEGLDRSGGGDPVRFEGKAERDGTAWVKTDAFEYMMAGGKTVVRPVSEWKPLRDDGSDVQRLLYQGLSGARPPRPPHEEFATWARSVMTVKRSETKEMIGDRGTRVYEIEFTSEHARELVQSLFPMGKWMDRIPLDRPTGSAKAWVDNDGRILKTEISAKIAGSLQGSQVQLVATRTTTFSDFDAAKVQIPDDARKALEAK